jgi:hypothetical protein
VTGSQSINGSTDLAAPKTVRLLLDGTTASGGRLIRQWGPGSPLTGTNSIYDLWISTGACNGVHTLIFEVKKDSTGERAIASIPITVANPGGTSCR